MSAEWYKNSSTQMHDPDMESIQSNDPASCAVWEWVKGECRRNNSDKLDSLSDDEVTVASRRLGIEPDRMKNILNLIASVGWITPDKRVRSWSKWQTSNPRKGNPPRSRWERKQDLEAIDERLKELSWHRSEVAGGEYLWSSEKARVEYFGLKKQRRGILGMMVEEAKCS
jgi:hypothetical protein